MAVKKQVNIVGRTDGQKDLIQTIQGSTITFALGPAGTGKTHIAISLALKALRDKEVERIVLTRPVVEAGEHLGFLPGGLNEKMDPYMRPLFDSFRMHMSPEELQGLIEIGTIEIAPIAYLRGRTLNRSFVVADECQNTTHEQMYMLLTRLGANSKMVINGDLTQIDIPGGTTRSGLYEARRVLYPGIPHVNFVELTGSDVVRHPVVKGIIEQYEKKKKPEFADLDIPELLAPSTNGHNGQ